MGAYMGQVGNPAIMLSIDLDMGPKMKKPTSRHVMVTIRTAVIDHLIDNGPLPGHVVGRRIGISPEQISRTLTALVKGERVTRIRVEGKTFFHYMVTDVQRNKHLRETTSQNLTAPLEDIPQRLRFLNGLWQKSPHRGHPVLAAIIKYYERTLRALRKDGDDA